jgi:hypothetical protein
MNRILSTRPGRGFSGILHLNSLKVIACLLVFMTSMSAGFSQNKALSFNGTSNYVSTSAYPVPTSGDFTVELWVYATAGGQRQFLSQGQSGSAFFMGMNASGNIWLGDSWATSVPMPLNEWTHLAVIKSGTNGTLYVNGVQRATTATYSIGSGGTAFYIGKQYGASTDYTSGNIDEVRVWNTARSATQVKDGMYGTISTSTANLRICYQLNEGAGTTIYNNSTSPDATASSEGTLQNGTTWLASSPVQRNENGLHFDGSDDHIKTPTSTDYESTDATIECWVRTEALSGNACILGYRSVTTRYSFHMNATTIGMWNGSAYRTINRTFTPGQWYHLAFVMTASTTTIYVNGTSIGTTGHARSNVTGVEFFVGVAMSNTLSIMEPFKGAMDDIRIWNVARTATQIQNNMYSDLAGTETNLVRYWNFNQGAPGANNTGLSKAIDFTSRNGHGQLNNFGLNGNSSNWVSHSTATLNPPPVVTSFTPTSATAGTTINISGNNFNTTAANNIVFFGSTKATVTASTTTSLTVTAPQGSIYKPISVTNTAYGLTGVSALPFIATFSGGSGSPNFSSAANFTSNTNPQGVAIGDIDGDGKADMIVANTDGSNISIYRNIHSTGVVTTSSFGAKTDFTTLASPVAIALDDADGDGKKDIVVINAGTGGLSVFRNISSSGTISLATRVDFTLGASGRSVALGDINGDGRPEIIAGTDGSLYVYTNTATTGTITTSSFGGAISLYTGGGQFNITAQDLDGDTKTDIAGTEFNGTDANLFILRNIHSTGSITTGSLASKVNFAISTTSNPFSAPAIGDLDGDGKLDIVVANPTENNVWIYRNTSVNGSFTASSLAAPVKIATGTTPLSVSIADITGDGKADIFVANSADNTVSALRNKTTTGTIVATSFANKIDFSTSTGSKNLAAGDFNNDGKMELVVSASTDAQVSVLPNTTTSITLPLHFLSFNGHIIENDVRLDWKTADEQNTLSFEVERSTDARQFSVVGIVAAANTPGDHSYTFTDLNSIQPSIPVLYYRIKQRDINGNFTYSPVIRLAITGQNNSVVLYPNPVQDLANLSVNVTKTQPVILRIYDSKGMLIKKQSHHLPAGSSSLSVDLASLTKGVYYLELKGDTFSKRISFVK